MKKTFAIAVLGAMLLFTLAAHADTSYNVLVTTHYQFGCPTLSVPGACGNPDTSFVTLTNNGASTYNGTIGTVAILGGGGTDWSQAYAGITLAPGASFTFNPGGLNGTENSNVGGFNGPTGTTQNGIQIYLNGAFTTGADTTGALNLSVYDKDIHSGVVRTNPFGVVVDSYVLQGGDPFGRDTGDSFETTQADGHFTFEHRAAGGQVPEPASLALLGSGLIGLAGRIRKRTK